ncbi:zinc finger protein CO3-like [Curcuma longa]|uniref:zinc finger protein CO3-like n=1 Tax=Curcuma longa TaxID=136217 RepID=UPI003D9F03C9
MMKVEATGGRWAAATPPPPRTCDSCRSAPCAVYCRADAASLCAACDATIHSANQLARRHHRVPLPHPGAAGGLVVRPGLALPLPYHVALPAYRDAADEDEEEADSWLLLDPAEEEIAGEVDDLLDLVEYNSGESQGKSEESVGVVPSDQKQSLEMAYDASNGFNYSVSLHQSVSPSSMEVPVGSMADISEGTISLFSGNHPLPMLPHFGSMDREARVLRYREKRKMRRFEKTIRYASRKAYAETRPRIKGRFAKKSNIDLEVDQMFASPALGGDLAFGVVPSFSYV